MAVNTVRGVVNFGPRLTKNIASKVKSIPLKVASNPETSKILSLLKTKAKQAKEITATTLSKVKTIPLKLKEGLKGIKIVPNTYHSQSLKGGHREGRSVLLTCQSSTMPHLRITAKQRANSWLGNAPATSWVHFMARGWLIRASPLSSRAYRATFRS